MVEFRLGPDLVARLALCEEYGYTSGDELNRFVSVGYASAGGAVAARVSAARPSALSPASRCEHLAKRCVRDPLFPGLPGAPADAPSPVPGLLSVDGRLEEGYLCAVAGLSMAFTSLPDADVTVVWRGFDLDPVSLTRTA